MHLYQVTDGDQVALIVAANDWCAKETAKYYGIETILAIYTLEPDLMTITDTGLKSVPQLIEEYKDTRIVRIE